MATIKGIKLLHKRYTIEQWTDGTGLTSIPTLAFGEFGIATDTKEVRCNTYSSDAISFADSTLVSFPDFGTTTDATDTGLGDLEYIRGIFFDNTADSTTGATLTAVKGTLPTLELKKKDGTSGAFITALEVSGHTITYSLGDAPTSTLTISSAHSGDAVQSGKSIAVVSAIENNSSSGHDHKIKYTTVAVPSLDYVEGIVDAVGIEVNTSGTGDYVSSITLADDKRTLTQHLASLPDMPTGSGSATSSGVNVLRSATLSSDHTLSGTTVALKGSTNAEGGEITVESTDGGITFGFKENVYALKSEISMAMIFKGTLGTSGTITALPTASAETAGHSYKVTTAGTYGSLDCDVGDLVVCRQADSGTSYEWILIPAGDDTDDFVSAVNVGKGITKSGTALAPTLTHTDYSSATTGKTGGTLATSDYGVTGKVITSITLDTDGFGHVTATPEIYEGDFVNAAGAKKIAEDNESTTTVTGTGKITVTDGSTDSLDHAYTITHAGITKNNTTTGGGGLDHADTFTAVTSVTYDDTGHVSGVNTATYKLPTDNNDWRPVNVNGEELLSSTSSTALSIATATTDSITGITATVNDATGTVTLKTLGKATFTTYGFGKLGNATTLTINSANKVYGVGMNSSGQLAVAVPWENTDMYTNDSGTSGHLDTDSGTDNELRFVAIKRDHAGHVMTAEDIYTIDGNA